MLMVDSNVIIEFWRNPTERLRRAFCAQECCICGVQTAELLYGAVSERDADEIALAISAFTLLPVEHEDWTRLGSLLYRLRKRGVTVPFPDALIACIALKHGTPVWTLDKHFHLIQTVFPALELYRTE